MEPNELRRYTNLPSVLRMLQTKAVTLLPPDTWDDQNDRRLLEAFRLHKGYCTVLALCFSEAAETYHHWKIFSPGTDGVCVVFNREKLLSSLPAIEVKHQRVKYYTVGKLSEEEPTGDQLPFAKRVAYEPEKEYRLLYLSSTEERRSKEVPFSKGAIERIIINPWMPQVLVKAVEQSLRAINGFEELDILQSKVTDGPAWRQLAEKFAHSKSDTDLRP